MTALRLYTDGSCATPGAVGGWAWILWERLLQLDGCLAVMWRHVPGHRPKKDTSDDAHYNPEVDALAVEARRGFVVPDPGQG